MQYPCTTCNHRIKCVIKTCDALNAWLAQEREKDEKEAKELSFMRY